MPWATRTAWPWPWFAEDGLEAALARRAPRREYRRKLDGEAEAHLITLSCSPPPAGRQFWIFKLLADRMVELRFVDGISYETVRRVLKKLALVAAVGAAGGRVAAPPTGRRADCRGRPAGSPPAGRRAMLPTSACPIVGVARPLAEMWHHVPCARRAILEGVVIDIIRDPDPRPGPGTRG